MIDNLPNMALTGTRPMINDTESATGIEMVARIYAKMQELISDYNNFETRVNEFYSEFLNNSNGNFNDFKVGLRQEFQDFIDRVEIQVEGLSQLAKTAQTAVTIANAADTKSGVADANAKIALNTANTALTRAQRALIDSEDALTRSQNAEETASDALAKVQYKKVEITAESDNGTLTLSLPDEPMNEIIINVLGVNKNLESGFGYYLAVAKNANASFSECIQISKIGFGLQTSKCRLSQSIKINNNIVIPSDCIAVADGGGVDPYNFDRNIATIAYDNFVGNINGKIGTVAIAGCYGNDVHEGTKIIVQYR